MSDEKVLTYLHTCVTGSDHVVRVPRLPIDLAALMQERYPGTRYAPPTVWWNDYQQWANTSLATLRGTLDTVHEQLLSPTAIGYGGVSSRVAYRSASRRIGWTISELPFVYVIRAGQLMSRL